MKIDELKKDLDDRTLYLYQGRVWKVKSFFIEPSVTMICADTREEISFGISSLIADSFKRIPEEVTNVNN